MTNKETYNNDLETDLKTWLSNGDENLFNTKIYLPLCNYTGGILKKYKIYDDYQEVVETMITDVVTKLHTYDATKGTTILSYIRHLIEWSMGMTIAKRVNIQKRYPHVSIYNDDGDVIDTIAGVTEPVNIEAEPELSNEEYYYRRVDELMGLLEELPPLPGNTCRKVKEGLIRIFNNKGKNTMGHHWKRTTGFCGLTLGIGGETQALKRIVRKLTSLRKSKSIYYMNSVDMVQPETKDKYEYNNADSIDNGCS